MNKKIVRFIAVLIVAVMVLGLFSGVLAMFAWASVDDTTPRLVGDISVDHGTGLIDVGDTFGITFEFRFSLFSEDNYDDCYIESDVFEWSQKIDDIKIEKLDGYSNIYKVKISNVRYANRASSFTLDFKIPYGDKTASLSLNLSDDNHSRFVSYSSGGGSSGGGADGFDGFVIYTADTTVSKQLKVGEETRGLTITFYYDGYGIDLEDYDSDQFSIPANSSFSWSRSSRLRTDTHGNRNRARLTNITYNGGGDRILRVNLISGEAFEVPIPNRYFGDESDGDDPPASDIVVESVIAKNGEGQRLVEITEDTPPFTVEITYNDIGLHQETKNYLERAGLQTFVTNAAGFKTPGGTRGKLEYLGTSSGYPRFRATFDNIESDGSANSFGFRVQYDLSNYDNSIKGEGTAILYQVIKEEDDDEIAPLKPNVIVEAYSYGEESITAGDEFNLDVTFKNTSKLVGVENVVMTVEPGTGFAIAAASNTDFFAAMTPGEAIPYAVLLKANPAGDSAGAQTDYSITVKFTYQYLSKKEYAAGESSVKIAIPVVQLDRFAIDEITDYTSNLMVGEEGYLSVPITNKGKSPTYNITGSVRMKPEVDVLAPSLHFGNLEAGKSDTLDINITINTPGQHSGTVVIQYEDENMQQKEISAPFEVLVNEIMMDTQEMNPDMNPDAMAEGAMTPFTMAFCGAGGLMVAGPIAHYFIKRARIRGSGDMDEDF